MLSGGGVPLKLVPGFIPEVVSVVGLSPGGVPILDTPNRIKKQLPRCNRMALVCEYRRTGASGGGLVGGGGISGGAFPGGHFRGGHFWEGHFWEGHFWGGISGGGEVVIKTELFQSPRDWGMSTDYILVRFGVSRMVSIRRPPPPGDPERMVALRSRALARILISAGYGLSPWYTGSTW